MANYQTQLQSLGYRYDTNTATGYNKINGFSFIVSILTSSKVFIVSADCKPQNENDAVELNKYLQQFTADRKKTVNSAAFDGKTISISYPMGLSTNITDRVKEATDAIMYFIGQCGCVPICRGCGQPVNTDIYAVGGKVASLCPNCFSQVQNGMMAETRAEAEKTTNVPMGILGAALGGLVGAVIWVIFYMLGYIVYIAGFAAGFLGLAGFKKFGKKLTTSGVIISIAISFIMLLAGMYLATAIDVYNAFKEYYDITFMDSFSIMSQLFDASSELSVLSPELHSEFCSSVAYNWIIGMITYVIAAVVSVIQFFKERKIKNQAVRLG